jgi:hypothetical protein
MWTTRFFNFKGRAIMRLAELFEVYQECVKRGHEHPSQAEVQDAANAVDMGLLTFGDITFIREELRQDKLLVME